MFKANNVKYKSLYRCLLRNYRAKDMELMDLKNHKDAKWLNKAL
jgi:hypothetical protein